MQVNFSGKYVWVFAGKSGTKFKYKMYKLSGYARLEFDSESATKVQFRWNMSVTASLASEAEFTSQSHNRSFVNVRCPIRGDYSETLTFSFTPSTTSEKTDTRILSIVKSATSLDTYSVFLGQCSATPDRTGAAVTLFESQSDNPATRTQQSLRTRSCLKFNFNYPESPAPEITSSEGFVDGGTIVRDINSEIASFGTLTDTSGKYKLVGWTDANGTPIQFPYTVTTDWETDIYAQWKKAGPSPKIKIDGEWLEGELRAKVNDQWVDASALYVKVGGEWIEIS